MDRRDQLASTFQIVRRAAHRLDAHALARHPAQRARAQGDDQLGLDEGAFLVEPPAADVDLARRWVLVEAPFAARLELEMLDRVGEEQPPPVRSEEHTSELQSLMRISYAVFCLKKKKQKI